jgi:peptidoglycan/xylan/chitin deacetylase (PgdA/CDA1 family)
LKSFLASIWGLNPFRRRQLIDYFTVIHYHQAKKDQFAAHLKYLSSNYNLCPLSQLRDHYVNGSKLPANSLFITFDDGWKSNFELLSTIVKNEYPITIFLSTGYVDTKKNPRSKTISDDFNLEENLMSSHTGRSAPEELNRGPDNLRKMLSSSEIKKMSKIVEFQSHGVNHHVSSEITYKQMDFELKESKRFIQELTGKEVYSFAYPYNVVSKNVPDLLSKNGYIIARAGTRKLNKIGINQFKIKSIGIESQWSIKQLRAALLLAELKTLMSI